MIIGSVIGIGIFFKNTSVFKINGYNPTGVIISWILASVIAILTAFSFAEVGFNHKNGAGLAGSVERMYGSKPARFIAFNNSFFYYGVLTFAVAAFTAESIVQIFVGANKDITTVMHIGYLMLITLGLIFFFLIFNYFSFKWSKRFQILTTGMKFIPLIATGVAGVIYGAMHPELSLFNPSVVLPDNAKMSPLNFANILTALPSILFAYDSFLGIASLQSEMENPKKQVPLSIVIGIGICIALHMIITIGQIMVNSGTAPGVFTTIFANNKTLSTVFSVLISFFIFVSAAGCLNSLMIVVLRTLTFSVQYRIFYGSWLLDKFSGDGVKSGFIISFFVYLFWWVVFLIPSVIFNTDAYIDGVSNIPSLFMFFVYGSVIFKAWTNRFTKKIHVNKISGFVVIAPLSTLGCYLAFGYQFFYQYSVRVFIDKTNYITWGLFASGGYTVSPVHAMILFFTMFAVFMVGPFINDAFMKLKYKKIKAHELLKSELLV